VKPKTILQWLNAGMNEVGQQYEEGDCYIADLIMAGYIYRQILSLEALRIPYRGMQESEEPKGTILICTVEGDMHDIGKDIFISTAQTEGYKVIDLGIDVNAQPIFDNIMHITPAILAMSGIITKSVKYMKDTVDLLSVNFLRHEVKILLGGISMSDEMCNYIGADYATKSADSGIIKCNEWINEKHGDQ
jgi:methanogenic corrinoid protein MtbC1